MVDRRLLRERNDMGRYMSIEEEERLKSAELDQGMSTWFIERIKGRDDHKRKLFATILGKLPDSTSQEVAPNDG